MIEKENQPFEQHHSKSLPSRPDQGQEQESSHDSHFLHPVATPTRAQQQRHRRNLRLNGQVDVEKGSLPRHTFNEDRRDSWIDRINSSTKNAIRRTSVIAAVDEKKLIDKVADSINQYGDQHKDDSWTDKVLNFLFPSMGLDSSSANSDETSDQTQQQSDGANTMKKKKDTKEKDKSALNKQNLEADTETDSSYQTFDGNVQGKVHREKSYADATQNGHRSSTSSSTSSWSMFNDDDSKQNHEDQSLDFSNKSQWPPL